MLMHIEGANNLTIWLPVERLNHFAALRRHVVRVLRRQPEEAWQRTVVHREPSVQAIQNASAGLISSDQQNDTSRGLK
jgi:hypothetical protein